MNQQYYSDKPVTSKPDDEFRRHPFGKRIAESILTSKSSDCLVYGIYGSWGEGKTSVLNFIGQELQSDIETILIKFNPWRFKDESTLLNQFFKKIAIEIEKKLSNSNNKEKKRGLWKKKNDPLKTTKENISELLGNYGSILSLIPVVGGAVKDGADVLSKNSQPDIEELKERIESYLSNLPGKIIVFIDDIDRLDKEEIFSLFRLIKLTADFPNTVYVLSFDEDMVAAALGVRFGSGDKKAGRNFIEKIIQVPLHLPAIQPFAIKEYCFKLLNNIFELHNVQLTQPEQEEFTHEFQRLLPRFKTPRLVIQYVNSVSFILPLLKNEINISDLLLLQAVKILYPSHYDLIKKNNELFVQSYWHIIMGHIDLAKKGYLTTGLSSASKKISQTEKDIIERLLKNIFPILQEVFDNEKFERTTIESWFNSKRVASPEYLAKYFSYTTMKGDISDEELDTFFNSLPLISSAEVAYSLEQIIAKSSPNVFIRKLNIINFPISWENTEKITKAIALNGTVFPETNSFQLFQISILSEAAIAITNILKKSANLGDVFMLARQVIEISRPANFACEIFRWLDGFELEDTELFTQDQLKELGKALIYNAINEAGDDTIFNLSKGGKIFSLWSNIDNENAKLHIENILNNRPELVIKFIKAFTPIGQSNLYPGLYFVDFGQNQYNYLKLILRLDLELLFHSIETAFPTVLNNNAKFLGEIERNESDDNIMKQFIHWYQIDRSGPSNDTPIS